MCGINGLVSLGAAPCDLAVVERMNSALAHRGPDDQGTFAGDGIVLGHRRLAIIDLSSAGHQPMFSASGRYVVVFNGEIYNFRELRAQLAGYPFRTETDTEVILAALERWGEGFIERLIGMFAIAVWDRTERSLLLVRDRLGIKPLYYYIDADRLIFSSEVRAILATGLVPRRLDDDALIDYLRYQTVHTPRTIIAGVRMLPAGSKLRLAGAEPKITRYWTPLPDADSGERVEIARIREALYRAVERRLVSDVPFGAFLSGGIDSSAIVAMMSEMTDKVATFSVTFAEPEFSEAHFARIVAKRYNTDHHEIRLTPEDFLAELPAALRSMDHPSGDGPNTYVVSKATKNAGVTMALSGLGGDELFAGYDVFRRSYRLAKLGLLNAVPRTIRAAGGALVASLRPSIGALKLAAAVAEPEVSPMTAYPLGRQVLLDSQIEELVSRAELPANSVERWLGSLGTDPRFTALPVLSQVSVAEIGTYLQDVLLRDTDQMSMAHSLEVRVPFMDHEVVELLMRVPDQQKYPRTPKRLLVEALDGLLPNEVVNRPKMGFTLPFARWLKNELSTFCAKRLDSLAERRQFRAEPVRDLWTSFLANDPRLSWSRIWMLAVLDDWLTRHSVS
jgi:asparagine synthase (glutamine-hydrolysing)